MGDPKLGTSKSGKDMHYSVGAVIERDGKYLLIDRATEPFGFAGIAGHIDVGETPDDALKREVLEEVGLTVTKYGKITERELDWNNCNKGIGVHYWHLFECKVSGEIKRNKRETKSAGWYSPEEIRKLRLEPVWQYWFEQLPII